MSAKIMGIINATPDSFYDGDPQNNLQTLLAKCRQYIQDGADILDIGGESTRPFATPVTAEEELARTLDLVKTARQEWPEIVLSQDTFKLPVAQEALKAGVNMINDVSGTPDPEMFRLVKDFGAQIVITHNNPDPANMHQVLDYKDLIAEVKDFLVTKITQARHCGLTAEQIIIDPGFGFAKNRAHNYRLLAHLDEFKTLGVRLLIGLSHKKFLSQPGEKPPKRKTQTLCANFAALRAGADILRVHDPRETLKVVQFFNELEANV
ncbi:MAG: dihydropteroate synthase [Elusimicrobiaceae bacterium]|nr:dihydropteroate synthase [Elusimicrobiaceae bacterium]